MAKMLNIFGVEFIKRLMFVKIGIHLILLLVMPRYSDVMTMIPAGYVTMTNGSKARSKCLTFLGTNFQL